MSRRHRIAPMCEEHLDAMIFGLQLASNPKVKERREAWYRGIKDDTDMLSGLSADAMIAALKQFNPAYIVELLQRHPESSLRHTVVMSMRNSADRERMLGILGLEGAA